MSISPLYVPLFSIEEVILDKDSGLPLSSGVVKFYRDLQRATPKPVYQITGNPPDYTFESVGNELTLGIAGDFVDSDGNPFVPYAYPYDSEGEVDLYYITVESEGAVAQFTREAVPYLGTGSTPPEERTNTENELSNPQFVEVLFPGTGSTVIPVTGSGTVTKIAPGWDLVTTGTGNVTVERLEPTTAGIDTNPPYALRIEADSALGATITLRQRLNNSPSILRGGYASATLMAAVISGGSSAISLSYAPSTGIPKTIIPSTNVSTDGNYHALAGNAVIPEQANTAASTGYVDINITIPTARNIAITSIQVVGTSYSIDIPFDEQTADRQKDHLFHYYEDSILHQPKESILTGWDFSLNPWQFRDPAASNVANNTYTADQTIIVQQAYVASATGNNISVARGTAAQNFAFIATAVTADNKFAMIQYIDSSTMRRYWGKKLSCRVNAKIVTPTHSSTVRIKAKLLYRSSVPGTIAQARPIASWNAVSNTFTYEAGWTALTPLNDPTYTLLTSYSAFDFDQFTLPAADNDNMTLALMIYTIDAMDQTATADAIHFDNISLVHNDFAIDVQAETYDQAKRKCEYYYEKSYNDGTLPGTVTAVGQRMANIGIVKGAPDDVSFQTFEVVFNTIKRGNVTPTFYSPNSATVDRLRIGIRNSGANSFVDSATSNWLADGASRGSCVMLGNNNASATTLATNLANQGCIFYHYVADARLGV